mgnify:FL=1
MPPTPERPRTAAPDAGTSESTRPLKRLLRLLAIDRRDILFVYLYAAVNGLVALSLPLGIQAIIGLILAGRVSTSWIILTIIVTAGVALSGLLQVVQLSITEVLQQRIFTRSAFEFAYRIPRFKTEAMRGIYAPELVNRFFDTLNVQKGLSKLLLDFTASGLQILFGLILLSFYHPFFIFFGVFLAALLGAIVYWTGPKGLKTSLKESSDKYRVAHWLQELARGFSTFKLAGQTELPLERTDGLVQSYLGHRKQHFKLLIFQYSSIVGFKALITLGLLVIGGLLVIDNEITIGQFVASEIIIILIMNSAEKLILTMEPIYDVLTAVEKMGHVTDIPLDREGSDNNVNAPDTAGFKVQLIDVALPMGRYVNRPVLSGVNLELPAGSRAAVVGPPASGKTALLHVLSGLLEPSTGSRILNGIPAKNWDMRVLRRHIGDYLAQEVIFDGTLSDNLTVGRAGIDIEDLRWAAEAVGLMPIIESWPDGFSTRLGSDGEGLPQTFVHRIFLARAIVGRPRLLVLDPFLRPFEEAERESLSEFLARPEHPWTLVAATGDAAFLKRCTHVIHMREGRIERIEPTRSDA